MLDTQAAYRGLKPQTALMRAASGMSRTIDLRRPKLNLAQQAEVDRPPELRILRRRLKLLQPIFQDRKRYIASAKGTPLYDSTDEPIKLIAI